SADPFAHLRSLDTPFPERRVAVLANTGASFYLVAGSDDFAFVNPTTLVADVDPLELGGEITAVALSPTANTAFVLDAKQEIALLVFDADGSLSGSWKTTTELPDNQFVLAGTMLPTGNALLTLSGTSVAVVDITASVTAQAWKV